MKKRINLILLIFIASICSACGESFEWETFNPIELDIDGVELEHSIRDNKGIYTGDIPTGEIHFLVIGTGKYASSAVVAGVTIDGIEQVHENDIPYDSEPPWYERSPILSGDWGKIKYLTEESPYLIEFTILPNENDNERQFEFLFGGAYKNAIIQLRQPPIQ